jgi:hypothetical protein
MGGACIFYLRRSPPRDCLPSHPLLSAAKQCQGTPLSWLAGCSGSIIIQVEITEARKEASFWEVRFLEVVCPLLGR